MSPLEELDAVKHAILLATPVRYNMNTKTFPWMCPRCREKTVVPLKKDYALTAVHDGQSYEVTVRDAQVPT